MTGPFEVRPVGRVESPLKSLADSPMQGDEGAPDAELVFEDEYAPGLRSIAVGDECVVLTWLHQAARDTLTVHPRGDRARELAGVFATRSPDRPNPIGLHRVRVLSVDGLRVRVSGIEAIDGTPILDLKPVIGGVDER
jgi:tRNA-Thr(GGU) m(6)t(6)A37 methyltransferase TsaA